MTGRDLVARLKRDDHRLGDLAMYADHLGLEPADGESETRFRERVAGRLRAQGSIIEAHEVLAGHRYDDPNADGRVVAGIAGALAGALGMGPPPRTHDPERQLGDEIAVGTLALAPPDPGQEAIRAMFDAFGPGAAMDVLDAFGGGR